MQPRTGKTVTKPEFFLIFKSVNFTVKTRFAKYDRTAQKYQCLNTGMVRVEKQGFSQFLTVRYTRKDI